MTDFIVAATVKSAIVDIRPGVRAPCCPEERTSWAPPRSSPRLRTSSSEYELPDVPDGGLHGPHYDQVRDSRRPAGHASPRMSRRTDFVAAAAIKSLFVDANPGMACVVLVLP